MNQKQKERIEKAIKERTNVDLNFEWGIVESVAINEVISICQHEINKDYTSKHKRFLSPYEEGYLDALDIAMIILEGLKIER